MVALLAGVALVAFVAGVALASPGFGRVAFVTGAVLVAGAALVAGVVAVVEPGAVVVAVGRPELGVGLVRGRHRLMSPVDRRLILADAALGRRSTRTSSA